MLSTVLPMSAVVFQRKQARYWQALPVRSMAGVLIALFFTVGAWGFFLDLIRWKRLPLWALLISASLFGVAGVVSFVTVRRRVFKLIPVLIILQPRPAMCPIGCRGGRTSCFLTRPSANYTRCHLHHDSQDAGYWSFLLFINTQGLEQVRTRTELDLAYSMQQLLAPAITHRTELFEAYGHSLPSEEVGGDLVDLIPTEAGWIACLADVSGHGIQPAF